MTMRITGSRRQAPWRGALRALLVVIAILVTCLILLEVIASFLVDWFWFSAVGYLDIFWIRIVAEAEIFIVVFIATSIILWANGSLALRFSQSQWEKDVTDDELKSAGTATLPETLDSTRRWLPWRLVIPLVAGLLAMLVAWGEVANWSVFSGSSTRSLMAGPIPFMTKISAFISLRCPPMSQSRIGCLSRFS